MIFYLYLALLVLSYVIWFVRRVRREYEQLKKLDAAAERARIVELRGFAFHLHQMRPDVLPRAEADRLCELEGERASAGIVERLLNLYDAIVPQGIVVGRASPPITYGGTRSWPYVAARHAARGYAPERTITAHRFPLILPDSVRHRHLYIIGKSGSGKSTQIRTDALQDMRRGAGVGIIAPEAELVTEELLPFVPEERLDDVIILDPADTTRPVPLNPLHVDEGEDFDRKLDETLSIFHRLIAEDGTGAPRLETILRYVLHGLMSIPGTTLLDFPRLLDRTDETFRKWVVGQLPDEEARHFWTSTYPSFPRDAHLSLLNRLGRFLQPKVIRNVLCQPNASLDVRSAMDTGKILAFIVSDGILGEQNAQLLGQLGVAKLQMAAMSRANIPKDARRPFHLYIDEFQSFCGVAGASYEKMLSRSRKYALILTIAHQQCGQIPESVMREILGNVGNLMIFEVGATDARRLSHELAGVAPHFDHTSLTSIPTGGAYCLFDRKLSFAWTTPPPKGGNEWIRDEAIRRSRERYGVVPASGSLPRPGPPAPLSELNAGDVF